MSVIGADIDAERWAIAVGVQADVFGIVGTTQSGNLRVEKAIAEGGFGVVYRAFHVAFRAPVALKCLKVPGQLNAAQRETFLEKFRGEAELLFRLSASIPQVVRPLNVDQLALEDGRFVPYIALEWLEGEPLSAIIEQRKLAGKAPIQLDKLVKLLSPIAQALARAHRFQGPGGELAIVHRDLKPENIFVTVVDGREQVRILDYGIAKARAAASSEAGRATSEQMHVFTPAYAAPEQWVPTRFGQTGPWTDVYGLAITMVEALLGSPPIAGEFHTMLAIAIDESRRPTPNAYQVGIPPALERAFAAALTVDPKQRLQSIEAFWGMLEDALGWTRTFGHAQTLPGRALSSIPATGTEFELPVGALSAPPLPPEYANLQLDIGGRASDPAAPTAAAGSLELPDLEAAPSCRGQVQTPKGPSRAAGQAASLDLFDEGIEHGAGFEVSTESNPLSANLHHHSSGAMRRRPMETPMRFPTERDDSLRTYRERLAGPVKLLALAALISIADIAIVSVTGTEFMMGPVKLSYIAAPLAVTAFALAIWRFFSE